MFVYDSAWLAVAGEGLYFFAVEDFVLEDVFVHGGSPAYGEPLRMALATAAWSAHDESMRSSMSSLKPQAIR